MEAFLKQLNTIPEAAELAERVEAPVSAGDVLGTLRLTAGDEVLAVGCCWGSDIGHDYATIAAEGFTKRLVEVDGKPQLI